MKNCFKFVILTDKEEEDLISNVNACLDVDGPVLEYKVVKSGRYSGIWRKTNRLMTDSYYTMFFQNETPPPRNSRFGFCVSVSLRELAAVYFANHTIRNLIYFPNHTDSDWKYLWKGYKRSVQEVFKIKWNLRVLSSKVLSDELSYIKSFLQPFWCNRFNPCWDLNPEPSP